MATHSGRRVRQAGNVRIVADAAMAWLRRIGSSVMWRDPWTTHSPFREQDRADQPGDGVFVGKPKAHEANIPTSFVRV